jgi:hypothetical protein
MSKKERAFELFSQDKRPSHPDLKALGLTNRTLYSYFQHFKKIGQEPKEGTGQVSTQLTGTTVVITVEVRLGQSQR